MPIASQAYAGYLVYSPRLRKCARVSATRRGYLEAPAWFFYKCLKLARLVKFILKPLSISEEKCTFLSQK
jgi:hypothetical protein